MPVEIYASSEVVIAWRQETPFGPIVCRKQTTKSPYRPEPFIAYWYEVPLESEFVYHRDGRDRNVRDMSLGPFTCDARLHLRVGEDFRYNLFVIHEGVRVLIYEPWYHFTQLAARCHWVTHLLQEQGKPVRDRACGSRERRRGPRRSRGARRGPRCLGARALPSDARLA